MPSIENRPIATPHIDNVTFARHARAIVLHHGERILNEVPTTIRRVRHFMLVMTITLPAFLAGLLVVLWHFAR